MKTVAVLLVLGMVVGTCVALEAEAAAKLAFRAFQKQYKKTYGSAEEEARRYEVFKMSMERVAKSGNPAHGITKFSDLTPEEFKSMYLRRGSRGGAAQGLRGWDGECTACKRFPEMAKVGAEGVDWTTKGAVTRVKDQGQCGSCWSFGTTGDIEGTWFLAGHELVSLSEQELVSCDRGGEDAGCNGGLQEDAFTWVIKKGGLVAESTYPYTSGRGIRGECKTEREQPVAANISSWYQVSKSAAGESDIVRQLPQVGPITIGINAGPMQDYAGGIDNPRHCSAEELDHAVLIVGYGEENGKAYWKIKNSWNTDWGEDGYYRIVRGENKCGVAMDAVHSKV